MDFRKLFQQNAYLKETRAIITKITENERGKEIVFHRSNFFPTGGGQPCDLGKITLLDDTVLDVIDVYESEETGEVIHLVPDSGSAEVGQEAQLAIDWDRRFLMMQRHSGEHVLSGAFYFTCGGMNKGFHMGENYITIDIDLGGERVTRELVDRTEALANKAIWDNLEVRTDYFEDSKAASVMPTRKPVNIEGAVSIVTFGDINDPFDCVACCGTHVARTGEIGQIKVYKWEFNRGMNRIYFDCGKNAFEKSHEDSAILKEITDRFSCGSEDILYKLDAKEEKESALRADLAKLANHFKESEAARITEVINSGSETFANFDIDMIGPDDIIKTGFAIMDKVNAADLVLALTHIPSNTILLFAKGACKAGDLVKTYAKAHNGKGGGRPDNARAVFTCKEDVDAFLADVKAVKQ